MRPIVPVSLSGKPCTAKALRLAAAKLANQSVGSARAGGGGGAWPAVARAGPAARVAAVARAVVASSPLAQSAGAPSLLPAGRRLAYIWRWAVNNSDVDLMAHEMATTVFCLSPAGDNCVSARFFSAVAAGCLPVVICAHLSGAFPSAVKYDEFWIKHRQSEWTADPLALVRKLREMPISEIRRRQLAMERYRSDILYDASPFRMGSHILRAAHRCAQRRLSDPKSERCRTAAQQANGGAQAMMPPAVLRGHGMDTKGGTAAKGARAAAESPLGGGGGCTAAAPLRAGSASGRA